MKNVWSKLIAKVHTKRLADLSVMGFSKVIHRIINSKGKIYKKLQQKRLYDFRKDRGRQYPQSCPQSQNVTEIKEVAL